MGYVTYGVMAVIVALLLYIGLGMWSEATRPPDSTIIYSPQPEHKPAPGPEVGP
jgi:hypothetical protein